MCASGLKEPVRAEKIYAYKIAVSTYSIKQKGQAGT